VKQLRALFFADDLICYCQNKTQLKLAWNAIKKWSIENKVDVNFNKSAILETRVDNRTPRSLFSPIPEISLLREYQYLGVTFSDSLNMKLNQK
jgi:hypothetical protein